MLASGTHYAKPEKELTLTDLVEYKNLIPGKEYKLDRNTHGCGNRKNLSMWMAKSCDCRKQVSLRKKLTAA